MEISSEAYSGDSILYEITVDTLTEVVWVDEDGNQCELVLGVDTVDPSVQYAMLKLSTARELN